MLNHGAAILPSYFLNIPRTGWGECYCRLILVAERWQMTPQQGDLEPEVVDSQSNGSNIIIKFYLFMWSGLMVDSDITMYDLSYLLPCHLGDGDVKQKHKTTHIVWRTHWVF